MTIMIKGTGYGTVTSKLEPRTRNNGPNKP